MSTYDEMKEMQDRLDYAVYKNYHDKWDKFYFELFSGKKWNSPLPSYDELTNSHD